MDILLTAVVAAAVAGIVVVAMQRRGPAAAAAGHPASAEPRRTKADGALVQATATAPHPVSPPQPPAGVELAAADPAVATAPSDPGLESELRARRSEIARIEERLLSKEEALDVRLAELDRKERSFEDRTRNLEHQAERLKEAKQDQVRELERLSGLSAGQARQLLLRELEDELRHDRARLARQVEEEVRPDAA